MTSAVDVHCLSPWLLPAPFYLFRLPRSTCPLSPPRPPSLPFPSLPPMSHGSRSVTTQQRIPTNFLNFPKDLTIYLAIPTEIVCRNELFILIAVGQRREYRVPGILSSRPNWAPPPPHPQGSVAPPPFGSHWRTHSLGGGGGGGDKIPLVLYVHHNSFTQAEIRTVQADKLNNQHRHTSMIYATPQ